MERTLPTFLNGFYSKCGIRIFIGLFRALFLGAPIVVCASQVEKYFERKRRNEIKNLTFLFSCADLHFFVLNGQQRKHISTPIVDLRIVVIIRILLYVSLEKMVTFNIIFHIDDMSTTYCS